MKELEAALQIVSDALESEDSLATL